MSTSPVGSSTSGSSSTSGTSSSNSTADPFSTMSMSDFLQLMITQLQNQDPTQPLTNSDLFNQIGQLESIESSSRLNDTLNSLSTSEGLSNAGALIGKEVQGLDDNGAQASGQVAGVVMDSGTPKLIIGSQSVSLANVQQIVDPSLD